MFLFILFYMLTIVLKMISNIIIFNSILLFVIFAIALLYPKIDKKMILFDHPDNHRKIHNKSTPVIGGFFISIGLFLNIFFFNEILGLSPKISILYMILFLVFLITGIVDDTKRLSPKTRTIIILLSLILILPLEKGFIIDNISFKDLEYKIQLNQSSIIFTILCVFFVYNFLNFADGANGIAISLCIYFILFIFFKGNININFFIILLLVLLPVLLLNIFNKLFIGNNGSSILAILISLLFIQSYNYNQSPKADEIFIVFFIPAIDSLRVILVRVMQKKSPIQPDKNHLHHLFLGRINTKIIFIPYIILSITPYLISLQIGTVYSSIISIILYSFLVFLLKKNKINKNI